MSKSQQKTNTSYPCLSREKSWAKGQTQGGKQGNERRPRIEENKTKGERTDKRRANRKHKHKKRKNRRGSLDPPTHSISSLQQPSKFLHLLPLCLILHFNSHCTVQVNFNSLNTVATSVNQCTRVAFPSWVTGLGK
jgi:hypothetical protein